MEEIRTLRLALAVVKVDGHWTAGIVVLEHELRLAGEFIDAMDAVVAEIIDQQIVVQQRDAVQISYFLEKNPKIGDQKPKARKFGYLHTNWPFLTVFRWLPS